MDKGCPDPHGTGRVSFPVKASLCSDPESGVRRQPSGGPQSSGHKASSGPRLRPPACPAFLPVHNSFSGSFATAGAHTPAPLPPPLNPPKVSRSHLVTSPWL